MADQPDKDLEGLEPEEKIVRLQKRIQEAKVEEQKLAALLETSKSQAEVKKVKKELDEVLRSEQKETKKEESKSLEQEVQQEQQRNQEENRHKTSINTDYRLSQQSTLYDRVDNLSRDLERLRSYQSSASTPEQRQNVQEQMSELRSRVYQERDYASKKHADNAVESLSRLADLMRDAYR